MQFSVTSSRQVRSRVIKRRIMKGVGLRKLSFLGEYRRKSRYCSFAQERRARSFIALQMYGS
ncbi:hypothetical protein GWK48_00675 [Metallosphaera tengchongensis]|uniref:Uncharacterized protein n=1 Tax=Metallosphaera tengchongensis TaxID=1532350 RepID=A0A6N0NUF7_9CREN|nr:hypothetical protein [Metallosphaera tengchongensis]QKQ99107.1 hypothetical protein GWK48_00675 [Metallosphaera tengchongensis]